VALDEVVEEIEDLALPFGQGHHGAAIIRKGKAKVKPRARVAVVGDDVDPQIANGWSDATATPGHGP